MDRLPTSRKDALLVGSRRYFTGKACKRGHISARQAPGGTCVECNKENTRARYRKNPKLYAAKAKNWRNRNLEHARRISREQRRRLTGLPTPTRECPDICELCGTPPGKKSLALDHCHVTGKFRGWLCRRCNLGLGNFKDNVLVMQRAIHYISEQGI